jgi:Zn-dependent membrane protease YugP
VLLWILVLAPLALGLLAQQQVRATFNRYRRVRSRTGLTGAQVARALLDAHGLERVRVELIPSTLSDHYDPEAHALRLSHGVGDERSVAAIGIATHEVAHAYQDAEGSRAYRARKRVGEPLSRVAPFSGLILIGGFFFGSVALMALAVAYMAGLVLFSIVTLPVELGASRRAVTLLDSTHLATGEELLEIRSVLRAAAFTYAAGVAQQLGVFLALVLVAVAASS